MIYIQGDTLTTYISTVQFFKSSYYEKYIKNFTKNNNFIDIKNPILINKNQPFIILSFK